MRLPLRLNKLEKKIFEIVKRESGDSDLKGLFRKLILETISARIETETQGIYPLHNVYIHKLKVLNKPAFDRFKLAEVHAEAPEDFGQSVVKRAEEDEEGGYVPREGEEEREIAPITQREFTDDPEQM